MQFRDQTVNLPNKPQSRKSSQQNVSAHTSLKNTSTKLWTPTQVQKELEALVKSSVLSATLSVCGELINFSARTTSGHMYFDIVDEQKNKLSCTLFCVDRVVPVNIQQTLANGVQVVVNGQLRCVSKFKGSQYQLNVRKLKISENDSGIHERQLQEWTVMLREEGVFDADHKQLVPNYIEHVAILTSEEGAVINDIRQTLSNANVPVKMTIFDCAVQGENCVNRLLNHLRDICSASTNTYDAVLIARGGGSREDLSAFNQPLLLRGIDAMRGVGSLPPILCAIGHQTDHPLLDDVCDRAYMTPTYAAQSIAQPFVNARKHIQMNYNTTRLTLKKKADSLHSTFESLLYKIQNYRPHRQLNTSLQNKYNIIQSNMKYYLSNVHLRHTRMLETIKTFDLQTRIKQTLQETYNALNWKLQQRIHQYNTSWQTLYNQIHNAHPWSLFLHHKNCVILQNYKSNQESNILTIMQQGKGNLTMISGQGIVSIKYTVIQKDK